MLTFRNLDIDYAIMKAWWHVIMAYVHLTSSNNEETNDYVCDNRCRYRQRVQ